MTRFAAAVRILRDHDLEDGVGSHVLTSSRADGLVGGRYLLGEPLGMGGMGRVYYARDQVLGRDVAVKLLDAGGGGELARASTSEARAGAQLSHPGIAQVFDSGVHEGRPFLVMELVPGRGLDRLLRDGPRPAPLESAALVAQIADALEYAHRQGVVHCDIKPQNIIVTPDGQPKLVDFGIARLLSMTSSVGTEDIRGSAPYVAPEQVRGERVDGRADVYALGAVLYEALTGRPPFQGPTVTAVVAQHLTGTPPPPRSLNPQISAGLARVVLTALARDPSDRYARAGEFRDALQDVVRAEVASTQVRTESVGPLASTTILLPPARGGAPGAVRAKQATLGFIALALVTAGGGLTLMLLEPNAPPGAVISPVSPPPETVLIPDPTPSSVTNQGGGSGAPAAPATTAARPNETQDQGGGGGGDRPKVLERTQKDQEKVEEQAREEQEKVEEQMREAQKKADEQVREEQKKAEERTRDKPGGRN